MAFCLKRQTIQVEPFAPPWHGQPYSFGVYIECIYKVYTVGEAWFIVFAGLFLLNYIPKPGSCLCAMGVKVFTFWGVATTAGAGAGAGLLFQSGQKAGMRRKVQAKRCFSDLEKITNKS
jgi:hypothetical protein